MAQKQTTCLEHEKSWVQCPTLQKKSTGKMAQLVTHTLHKFGGLSSVLESKKKSKERTDLMFSDKQHGMEREDRQRQKEREGRGKSGDNSIK